MTHCTVFPPRTARGRLSTGRRWSTSPTELVAVSGSKLLDPGLPVRPSIRASASRQTPLCIANFQKSTDAQVKLVELKKISSSWARETFVKEGKWATIGTEQNGGVVDACAEALYKL